jgi:plasmid stabilization system protein ParE
MRLYRKVEIDPSADEDIDELYDYLVEVMSYDSARRYVLAMIDEVNSLVVYADCFAESRSATIRQVHPRARRMVSHNKKWVYVFYIEDDIVVVDRILKGKMIKG